MELPASVVYFLLGLSVAVFLDLFVPQKSLRQVLKVLGLGTPFKKTNEITTAADEEWVVMDK